MSSQNHVAEAVRQTTQGEDFWSADDLTRDLSPDQACRVPAGAPYSISTQVGHALFWQERWLRQIEGETVKPEYTDEEDFPSIACDDWSAVRGKFIAGFELAESIAASDDLERKVGDRTVGELLLKIAIHNAYHVGQIALLRQFSGFGMPVYKQAPPESVS